MQFTSTVFTLLAAAFSAIPAMAQPPADGVLNYDNRYDDPNGSLSTTACSADAGVLKGYKTFGSIPNFPHIAGSFFVDQFNSTRCGACYELLYNRADGLQVVLPFTVINSAQKGFVSSVQGLKDLTGLDVNEFPGDAAISYREVPSYDCGF